MLRSADSIADGAVLTTAICVVGGGAAGLSIARELGRAGIETILLEAGGMRRDAAVQDAYRGTLADPAVHSRPEHFRARRFGGSTTMWGGRCVPFDPIDFEARDWVPLSGWPFRRADLEPFYRRAAAYCEIGAPEFDVTSALPDAAPELVSGFSSPDILTHGIERFSRPTDFGRLLGPDLAGSAHVQVLLHAPATQICLEPSGGHVRGVVARSRRGARFEVRAGHIVVATGGLETARLLLASDDVMAGGIGNAHGWLGRCYMSHLAGTLGEIRLARPERAVHGYERTNDGVYCRRRFALSAAAQRRLGLLNLIFRLHHPNAADPAHGDPVLSAMYLVKDLILYEYSRRLRTAPSRLRDRLAHLGNLVTGAPELLRFAPDWIARRHLDDRRLPSVVRPLRRGATALEFHAEQAPNPESRVTLGQDRDALGMRRLVVDWRPTRLDSASVAAGYRLLAEEFARTGAGAVTFDSATLEADVPREGAYGGHHLGTARMADNPRRGVVDRDCRVHGVDNLFVAGGAVFPTSGQANPTFTIVALALRLADRLRAHDRHSISAALTRQAAAARREVTA